MIIQEGEKNAKKYEKVRKITKNDAKTRPKGSNVIWRLVSALASLAPNLESKKNFKLPKRFCSTRGEVRDPRALRPLRGDTARPLASMTH